MNKSLMFAVMLSAVAAVAFASPAQTIADRGDTAFQKGAYAQAVEHWSRAFDAATISANKTEQVSLLVRIGRALFRQAKTDEAEKRFAEARAIAEAAGDRSGLVAAMIEQASVFRVRGNYPKVKSALDDALKIAIEIGDERLAAKARYSLGIYHTDLAQYSQASSVLQSCRATAGKLKDALLEAHCSNQLGSIAQLQGNRVVALDRYLTAQAGFEKLKARRESAIVTLNIGLLYNDAGKWDSARRQFERSLNIQTELNNANEANVCRQCIALSYVGAEQYAKARPLLEGCLQYFIRQGNTAGRAQTLMLFGDLDREANRSADALSRYQQALDIYQAGGNVGETANALIHVAKAQAVLKRFDKAAANAKRALELCIQSGRLPRAYIAASVLAIVYAETGKDDEVERYFEQAADLLEQLRVLWPSSSLRQSIFSNVRQLYTLYVQWLVERGRPEEALTVAQRGKSRSIMDLLARDGKRLESVLAEADRKQRNELRLAYLNTSAELNEARLATSAQPPSHEAYSALVSAARQKHRALQEFDARLAVRYPLLRAYSPVDVSFGDIASRLGADAALIEFVVSDRKLFVFTLTNSSDGRAIARAHTVDVTTAALRQKVVELRAEVSFRPTGEPNDAARSKAACKALYELAFRPHEADWAFKHRLVIGTDSSLHDVPFQALMDNSGRYLIERVSVETAFSGALWVESQRRADLQEKQRPDGLIVANPTLGMLSARGVTEKGGISLAMREAPLRPLPYAEEEGRQIRQELGGKSILLVRDQAKKAAVLEGMKSHTVLHFATHGLVNGVLPLLSALVLSPPAKDAPASDQFLWANELLEQNLSHVRLVTLSACESGRAPELRGEGMIGFSWAALAAGCPSSLVSLWRVDDRATEVWMRTFYSRWLSGRRKSDSARDATLALIQMNRGVWSHPYYWAAFSLSGSGD